MGHSVALMHPGRNPAEECWEHWRQALIKVDDLKFVNDVSECWVWYFTQEELLDDEQEQDVSETERICCFFYNFKGAVHLKVEVKSSYPHLHADARRFYFALLLFNSAKSLKKNTACFSS